MQFLISDTILGSSAQWPDLEALLDRARQNRCYIDAVNPESSLTNAWFKQTDGRRQQDWLNAVSWAAKDAAVFRLRKMVADVAPDPKAKPLAKVSLREAIDLADRTSALWLENGRNDRRFILSMMPPEQRATFLDWEKRRIISFESRGGLGELRVSLQELAERGLLDPRTNRALFDSDGEVPGHRSRDAEAMIAFCESVHLAYHCLVRRAIENYLPRKALWSWTTHDLRKRSERSKKIEAFGRMSVDQRHHFRMKAGWDRVPSAHVASLYQGISEIDHATLREGIDDNIASVYDTFMDEIYGWATKEEIDPGVQATIKDIADWIRVPYA